MNIDVSSLSPMMKQYVSVKQQYPEHVIFFRLGDFYEMFFDDAVAVSKALELTLTGKECGLEERAPMCGVPYHSVDVYLKKLIEKGFRVVICEQMEDPRTAKGLVKRDVVRIVTPGTLTDTNLLADDTNNYICAIFSKNGETAAAFADISTGECEVYSGKQKDPRSVIDELSRLSPAEVLVPEGFERDGEIERFVRKGLDISFTFVAPAAFDREANEPLLAAQFSVDDLSRLGLEDADDAAICALCGLFYYICDTQRATVGRFCEVRVIREKRFMELDLTARRNLELVETMRNKEKKGSLLWVLDRTKTSMGKRLLRSYIEQPLLKPGLINERLGAVGELVNSTVEHSELRNMLAGVYDLERLMTKVMYKSATPRDIKALAQTAEKMPEIKAQMSFAKSSLLAVIREGIDELTEISALVGNAIVDDPPALLKDGGIIKDGFNDELDRLRGIISNGKGVLNELLEKERERTGIKSLKLGYNHVFGYYLEVTRSYYQLVPSDYIRKQTLANAERFITEELKKTEEEISGAGEKVAVLESEIFGEVRDFIASQLVRVQQTAKAVAALDVLCSFAEVSLKNNYVMPDISADGVIDIRGGRHPVVELMIENEPYVPNDVYLDSGERRMSIITGPNMAGKSTYMRQCALIVIMAQMGCFVPAESARISVTDRIFTRVGASDDLTSGQSTFMVEMNEVSQILKSATKNSLVILDEVGRGTSTFDGISIATAVAEYIANKKKIGCKTLFATHYHELCALEGKVEGIHNYSVAVRKSGEDIRFLRKIVEGGTDDSYGIEVAKLAGLPPAVVSRARQVLAEIESGGLERSEKPVKEEPQVSFSSMQEDEVIKRIRMTDPDEYSPREALALLCELHDMLK
ncbi:MAG: DNA mismatch repair protein MutS [Oscillospiraceae bacterium]|nr:DNA mismatch repair protein MutS [Oscillospiraceae bacterium]